MNRQRPSSGAGAGSRPLMPGEAARALIKRKIQEAGKAARSSEDIFLGQAAGRVLAAAPQALSDSPAADNSALDGFAVYGADLARDGGPVRLRLVGQSLAGHPSAVKLKAGEALRIMTGGVMPEGADTVVALERTRILAVADRGWIELVPPLAVPGANVRPRGEDVRAGSRPVAAGARLRPAQIAMLASIGAARVQVCPRVRGAVLSTGDELRPLEKEKGKGGGKPLQAGEVFDSNRWLLHALLRRLDAEVIDCGLVGDHPGLIAEALRAAADRADIVITSGGVSTGDADFLPQVLEELGELWFRGVALRPGRPFMAGSLAGHAGLQPAGQSGRRRRLLLPVRQRGRADFGRRGGAIAGPAVLRPSGRGPAQVTGARGVPARPPAARRGGRAMGRQHRRAGGGERFTRWARPIAWWCCRRSAIGSRPAIWWRCNLSKPWCSGSREPAACRRFRRATATAAESPAAAVARRGQAIRSGRKNTRQTSQAGRWHRVLRRARGGRDRGAGKSPPPAHKIRAGCMSDS